MIFPAAQKIADAMEEICVAWEKISFVTNKIISVTKIIFSVIETVLWPAASGNLFPICYLRRSEKISSSR